MRCCTDDRQSRTAHTHVIMATTTMYTLISAQAWLLYVLLIIINFVSIEPSWMLMFESRAMCVQPQLAGY
jgi:hypothetical protein